jgi:Domain of unknown function (DUF5916)
VKGNFVVEIGKIILMLFVSAFVLTATETDGSYFVLQRVTSKITLDGMSSEVAWQNIKPLPLVMQIPNFGKQPSEKTEILVTYDNDYLYLAGRLYQSDPNNIKGSSMKRDEMGPGSDWFGVVLDTFNDNENALAFFTTPTGLRTDLSVFNDAQGDFPINISWNTFWDVKVVRNESGWFAEFRIPFSSLRFQDKDGKVVMGLSAWRWITSKQETVIFPAISPEVGQWSAFKPSMCKDILLTGVHSRKTVFVAPYILSGFNRTYQLNNAETAYLLEKDPVYEAGLDVKYGISSNMTFDITINTDFAQVEADDQQINLTRFSLFFPEKRLFFQERSSIFDFNLGGPNRLFYSRRIGLYEEQQIRLYGGVRLVGRAGAWDLGLMSMQTAAADVKNDDNEIEHIPAQNFSVLRLRRQVFNPYSYIGAMIASQIGMDGSYNIAYGMDGIIRLFGDYYFMLNWAQSIEQDGENKFFSLDPAHIRFSYDRRSLKGLINHFSYSRSGETYNPEMGFQDRDDFTRFSFRLGYGWLPGEGSRLLNHSLLFDSFVFLGNKDQEVESAEISAQYQLTTKSGFFGKLSLKGVHEGVDEAFSFDEEDDDDIKEENHDVPVGHYTFYGMDAFWVTPMIGNFLLEGNIYVGSFYDGWRLSFSLSPLWKISSAFELSGTYQINLIRFPDRDKQFNAHILRLRTLTMFNTKLSFSAFIQYNSSVDTISGNLRVRYNPREGNDLYLVYNEGMNTNRYRQIPVLPKTDNRTLMLKYTYTFNF